MPLVRCKQGDKPEAGPPDALLGAALRRAPGFGEQRWQLAGEAMAVPVSLQTAVGRLLCHDVPSPILSLQGLPLLARHALQSAPPIMLNRADSRVWRSMMTWRSRCRPVRSPPATVAGAAQAAGRQTRSRSRSCRRAASWLPCLAPAGCCSGIGRRARFTLPLLALPCRPAPRQCCTAHPSHGTALRNESHVGPIHRHKPVSLDL